MDQKVKITIHNGEVHIEAQGFKGKGCEAVTKIFAQGLPSKGDHKAEYYQETQGAQARLHGGGS
jgi:hypothetical protein